MTPTHSRAFRLTERDIAMLESIATARYLTAAALEWLHFPTWVRRWKAAQAAGTTASYRPAPHLYRRLNHLLDHNLIYRLRRPIERSLETFGREPDVYLLTADGAEILARYGSLSEEEVVLTRKRTRSYHNVGHAATIGAVYAAIKARVLLRNDSLALAGWRGDHILAREYDRVGAVVRRRNGSIQLQQVAVQPDATFEFQQGENRWRVFVEVDRGTRATATWATKIAAYKAYHGTVALKQRYGVESFTVLAITTTPAQRMTLMQATAGVLKQPWSNFLFAEETAIHPDLIGRSWSVLETVTPQVKRELRPDITVANHRFF